MLRNFESYHEYLFGYMYFDMCGKMNIDVMSTQPSHNHNTNTTDRRTVLFTP